MNMTKKITLTIAAVAVLALPACHQMPERCDSFGPNGAPDPTRPKISFAEGFDGPALVINQDPLVFSPKQVNVTITWQLPKEAGYTFVEQRGIHFEEKASRDIVKCERSENGLEFTCLNRHTILGATYKYDINVVGRDGRRVTLDPSVRN
jgi:hypothetical protein